MTQPIELVIFDLGGTLIEDTGDVPAAFRMALELHGYSVSAAEISRVRGASKREVIRRLVGDRETSGDDVSQRVYRSFQERLIELFRTRGVRPVDGVTKALAKLRDAGARIAITTGFDRRVTRSILGGLELKAMLDAVVCGDDVSAGRPAPHMIFRAMELTGVVSVHRVANVGDTTNDLRAGYRAGVATNVGVLTGAHDRNRLEQAPHTHILESAARVPAVLALDPAGHR